MFKRETEQAGSLSYLPIWHRAGCYFPSLVILRNTFKLSLKQFAVMEANNKPDIKLKVLNCMALQTCFHSSYPAELRVSPLFSMSPDIILYYMEIYNRPTHCFSVCVKSKAYVNRHLNYSKYL